MSTVEQMAFPFASLDFPAHTAITIDQMARKLNVSHNHLLNECDNGELCAVDLKGQKASRRHVRVPIESYRSYVLRRMTGPFRKDFLRDLPRHVREELLRELKESLK